MDHERPRQTQACSPLARLFDPPTKIGQLDPQKYSQSLGMTVRRYCHQILAQHQFRSYGRALQPPAISSWVGKDSNIKQAQDALYKRSELNSLATLGKYNLSLEENNI